MPVLPSGYRELVIVWGNPSPIPMQFTADADIGPIKVTKTVYLPERGQGESRHGLFLNPGTYPVRISAPGVSQQLEDVIIQPAKVTPYVEGYPSEAGGWWMGVVGGLKFEPVGIYLAFNIPSGFVVTRATLRYESFTTLNPSRQVWQGPAIWVNRSPVLPYDFVAGTVPGMLSLPVSPWVNKLGGAQVLTMWFYPMELDKLADMRAHRISGSNWTMSYGNFSLELE